MILETIFFSGLFSFEKKLRSELGLILLFLFISWFGLIINYKTFECVMSDSVICSKLSTQIYFK